MLFSLCLVVCLYVSMFVCVFVAVHVFVVMTFCIFLSIPLIHMPQETSGKAYPWDMEKHRLKKCGDWGFSSQLGGKSHTELKELGRFKISWIDRTFIASSTGQTMVI